MKKTMTIEDIDKTIHIYRQETKGNKYILRWYASSYIKHGRNMSWGLTEKEMKKICLLFWLCVFEWEWVHKCLRKCVCVSEIEKGDGQRV